LVNTAVAPTIFGIFAFSVLLLPFPAWHSAVARSASDFVILPTQEKPMKKIQLAPAGLLVCSALIGAASFAQHGSHSRTPYTGQEKREIKSLSPEEAEGYIQGRGLGLARAAELNSYPGPMHVLELASELQLSPQQKAEAQRLRNTMHQAARAGKLLVEREKELNQMFQTGRVTEDNLANAVREIARLQGEVRLVHLRAHVRMKRVLTAEQVVRYNRLRGYG
jgi:Spy/CpxP family protein refolding chaperone